MKFIIDAQLPKSISEWLNAIGHDSIHTMELPGANSTTDSSEWAERTGTGNKTP